MCSTLSRSSSLDRRDREQKPRKIEITDCSPSSFIPIGTRSNGQACLGTLGESFLASPDLPSCGRRRKNANQLGLKSCHKDQQCCLHSSQTRGINTGLTAIGPSPHSLASHPMSYCLYSSGSEADAEDSEEEFRSRTSGSGFNQPGAGSYFVEGERS